MKKVLACIIAVLLLVSMMPVVHAADATVYVTVSVDGKLELAAQPVTVSDTDTVETVLKKAHADFYSGGEAGFAAGIDAMYNMYMISQFWGVPGTPCVIVNDAPLGADMSKPASADVCPVANGDNIVVSVASDPMGAPNPYVSMSAADGLVSAKLWTLDFMTFQYKSSPLANAAVVDPTTGASLGTTDAAGNIAAPAADVVAIDGLSAIPLNVPTNSTTTNPPMQEVGSYTGLAEGEGITVFVTVTVDGKLQVAGQKVTVPFENPTIENVIKEAHKKWYPTGEGGFHAGINEMYMMYLIDTCWGVASTPYVLLNGTPLGADMSVPSSADTGKVVEGDQLVLACISMGVTNVPVIGLVNDGGNLVAKEWTLDMTTFAYDSSSYSNADIIDAKTGEVLGKTDGTGKLKMPAPESGVVAIPGLSAFAVSSDVEEFTPADTVFVPPALDYSLFGGKDGRDLLIILVYGLVMAVPMAVVIFIGGRKEIKNKGVKHFKKTW